MRDEVRDPADGALGAKSGAAAAGRERGRVSPPAGQAPDAASELFNRFRKAAEERGDQRLRRPPPSTGLAADPRSAARAAEQQISESSTNRSKDLRDPALLGETLKTLVRSRGWSAPVAVGSVISRWDQLVGEAIAEHCRPSSFEDGIVQVNCDSTAWATNLKLMKSTIMEVFDQELGKGIVTDIDIRGPQAPNWRRGRYSVRGGRGPRDTYG